MQSKTELEGIIPAVVTPLTEDNQLHIDNLQLHIRTVLDEGCHGILLLGTTGEGPSLSIDERLTVIEAGVEAAVDKVVLVNTGCASLEDTKALTERAFELGVDAVVVVPPFYYKKITTGGLLEYYLRLLAEAVPDDGTLMLYHIPQVTKVPITLELLEGLLDAHPDRIAGVKDSSGDFEHLKTLCSRFPDLSIFAGTDHLLLSGLRHGAAGCITAPSNILAPLNLAVFSAFKKQEFAEELQESLTAARVIFEKFTPFPATVKHLLAIRYGTTGWNLRPPLVPLPPEDQQVLQRDLAESGLELWLHWLNPT
ncbi:MAG: dihydrodipicolinate synthase family protein [Anaerolineales bacterium]|nr:dihydrodipicolinate synthase family protein [Anaerolineales bacterium]